MCKLRSRTTDVYVFAERVYGVYTANWRHKNTGRVEQRLFSGHLLSVSSPGTSTRPGMSRPGVAYAIFLNAHLLYEPVVLSLTNRRHVT